MLIIPSATKIFLVSGATDRRKQNDSLAAVVSGARRRRSYERVWGEKIFDIFLN